MLFLLLKNLFVYDLFGLELQFLTDLRPDQEVNEVQNTCRLVSGWRAMDSERENSVYYQKDPLAAVLAGDGVLSSLQVEAALMFRSPEANELNSVTLRQLAIDSRIQRYCSCRDATDAGATDATASVSDNEGHNDSDGGSDTTTTTHHNKQEPTIKQVVVIGAGMDTRPYRLSLPHTHWFEIDMPDVLTLKESLLSQAAVQSDRHLLRYGVKSCTRIAFNFQESTNVIFDLSEILAAHGHIASEPTLFLMEGLVMYLSPSDIRVLMESLLPVAAPHSRIIMSQVSLKYHYLLTNPLVVFVIESTTEMKSHQVATLFKSNLFSMDLGPKWHIQSTVNIGKEMFQSVGLTQWQVASHVVGNPPHLVNTAESLLDIVLTTDRC